MIYWNLQENDKYLESEKAIGTTACISNETLKAGWIWGNAFQTIKSYCSESRTD